MLRVNQETPSTHQRYRLPSTVLVGTIVGAWGVEGHARVRPETDSPRRFSPGNRLLVNGEALSIEQCRWHMGFVLLKLSGIDTPEEVGRLRGARLEVPLEDVEPLAPDSYYHFQILDMEVWTQEGEYLGRVESILSTGSNDVYVVRGEGREVLVPALEEVIVEVDTEMGRMTVDLPEGLL